MSNKDQRFFDRLTSISEKSKVKVPVQTVDKYLKASSTKPKAPQGVLK